MYRDPANFEFGQTGIPFPKLEVFAQSLLDTSNLVDLEDLIDDMNLSTAWGEEHLDLDGTTEVDWAKWRIETLEQQGEKLSLWDSTPNARRHLWQKAASEDRRKGVRGGNIERITRQDSGDAVKETLGCAKGVSEIENNNEFANRSESRCVTIPRWRMIDSALTDGGARERQSAEHWRYGFVHYRFKKPKKSNVLDKLRLKFFIVDCPPETKVNEHGTEELLIVASKTTRNHK